MENIIPICEALRELHDLPLNGKSDLCFWNKKADVVIKKIRALDPSEYNQLPHFIEHYLADADVRLKDLKYRKLQDQELKQFLDEKITSEQAKSAYRHSAPECCFETLKT